MSMLYRQFHMDLFEITFFKTNVKQKWFQGEESRRIQGGYKQIYIIGWYKSTNEIRAWLSVY